MKKPLRKRLINWIVLCGIFGALSLVFDQFAIQQESEIRRLERLSIQKSMDRRMISDYHHHLNLTRKSVEDFADQSAIRLKNLDRRDDISSFRKENEFVSEEGFRSASLLLKDFEYFSRVYLSVVKENYQRIDKVGLSTEQLKQMVESIVNQDFDIDRKKITIGEVQDSFLRLHQTSTALTQMGTQTYEKVMALGKEANDLSGQASLKRSYKQRFLILGTISQIISLMFLLIFFRALYSIQKESEVETEPKS